MPENDPIPSDLISPAEACRLLRHQGKKTNVHVVVRWIRKGRLRAWQGRVSRAEVIVLLRRATAAAATRALRQGILDWRRRHANGDGD
jgi:hypothetical protein